MHKKCKLFCKIGINSEVFPKRGICFIFSQYFAIGDSVRRGRRIDCVPMCFHMKNVSFGNTRKLKSRTYLFRRQRRRRRTALHRKQTKHRRKRITKRTESSNRRNARENRTSRESGEPKRTETERNRKPKQAASRSERQKKKYIHSRQNRSSGVLPKTENRSKQRTEANGKPKQPTNVRRAEKNEMPP